MADDKGQEKTLPATPRKKQLARKEGQVAKSRDLNSAVLLGGVILLVALFGSAWMDLVFRTLQKGLSFGSWWLPETGFAGVYTYWSQEFLKLAGPLFGAFCVLAIAGNLAQVKFLLVTKQLTPNLNRLNPLKGIHKLVSWNGLVELVKSVFKLILIGWITYATLTPELREMVRLSDQPLSQVLTYSALVAFKLVIRIWLAILVLALADYMYQRWSHARDLRMTRQEVKDEHKETEGDPRIKSRLRSLQYEMARRRMMQEVPKADVVIANPEHVAVALRYDRMKDMAPVVVAKGAGWLCARIKEIARQHGVPVIENPPMARFLYGSVALGQEIPSAMYKAVAELLAYVYRLKGKVNDGIRRP
ncbi:MAG: flagellar biosynthesis protein FlhB [bacterium]